MIGKTISHYKIIEKLGGGGMGVVYKAKDLKLDRFVALKFLPPHISVDEEEKERFIQEAKAASALDHANICTIHEIDEIAIEGQDQMFIVMAYYQGETLRNKIKDQIRQEGGPAHRRGLRIKEAIDIAVQIAQGLEKAHKKGIVHRDIKPANIFLTKDGMVKILDFGLAKLGNQTKLTKKGTTLGTVAYMSPEQARGEKVDHRTDIWSLGVVLYEMLTGELPFKGEYEQAVIYSILNEKPKPLTTLISGLPEILESIVYKTLIKNPNGRYQSAYDMLFDLMNLKNGQALEKVTIKKHLKMSKSLVGIIPVVLSFILLGIGYILFRPGDVKSFQIRYTSPLTISPGLEQDPAWSPEGTRIAYTSDESGNMDVWIRQIAAGQKINLTKDYIGYDGKPAWSPDGEWIVFVSERDGGGLFKISALGGIPKRVVSFTFAPTISYIGSIPKVCWSPDGTELAYASAGSLYTISSAGGTPVNIPLPPKGLIVGYAEPNWSPKGDRLVCTGFVGPGIATSQIWSVKRDGSDPIEITHGETFDKNPIWAPDNEHIFFISDRGGIYDIWWTPVDDRGRPTDETKALTAGVGVGTIALSKDGSKLAYAKLVESTNIWSIPVIPDCTLTVDQAKRITDDNNYIELLSCSPDGKWIAFDSNRSGNVDIWIMRIDGTELRQLTTHPAHDWGPNWSPDGKMLAFHSLRNGNRDLFMMPVAGGAVKSLTNHPEQDFLPRWSPDGEKILFFSSRSGNLDVWIFNNINEEPIQLTFHEAQDNNPIWSPDGSKIAFGSRRTGTGEIYIMSSEGRDLQQLTQVGWLAISPYFWSADGETIYAYGKGGPGDQGSNFWVVSPKNGTVKPLLNLTAKITEPAHCITGDGERVYFPLWECTGDIWMADLSTYE